MGVAEAGLILGLTRTPAMDRLGLKMNNPEFPPDEPDGAVEGAAASQHNDFTFQASCVG